MHQNFLDCVELALLQNLVNGLTAYTDRNQTEMN